VVVRRYIACDARATIKLGTATKPGCDVTAASCGFVCGPQA